MTVTRKISEDVHRPLLRVAVCATIGGTWEALPTSPRTGLLTGSNGYEVLRCERKALPDLGQAIFHYQVGVIDGVAVTAPRDLTTWFVRIQLAPRPTDAAIAAGFDPATLAWRTVWVGRCVDQVDRIAPGASYLIGERQYQCVDILGEAEHWPLLNTGFAFSGSTSIVRGHPGYNQRITDGQLKGNRDTTTVTFADGKVSFCHLHPSVGAPWFDDQVIAHAINSSRTAGAPWFALDASTGLLANSAQEWQVQAGDSCLTLLKRMLRRQRGRGLAFVGWDDDSAAPLAALALKLKVRPQLKDTITYTQPTFGATATIPGATAGGTVRDVDLVGDHCNVDSTFELGSSTHHRVGYLESIGDRIEVIVSPSIYDATLERRWTSTQVSDLLTLTANNRIGQMQKYEAVFQLFSLPRQWPLLMADGNGGTGERVDYRCADSGAIVSPDGLPRDTNPLEVELLPDLPTTVRTDGTTNRTRAEPMAFLRVSADRYIDCRTEAAVALALSVRADGILLRCPDDEATGTRAISDPTSPSLSALYATDQIVLTVAIRLPHCVRLASGDPASDRRLTITHRGHALWLAHDDAIGFLDHATGDATAGHPGQRG